MITEWFDRTGRPISIVEASDKLGDPCYRIVARDVWDGVIVSTIWVGIDHAAHGPKDHPNPDAGAPMIFETRVFGGPFDGHVWHYPNETQAIVGHNRVAAETSTQLDKIKNETP